MIVVTCGLVFAPVSYVGAGLSTQAGSSGWQPLGLVYESNMINAPTLVGDSAGIIHLIWTGHTLGQPDDSPEVVLYARWDGSGWIGETDVQAATTGAAWTEAVVGTDSILHLIWTDEQQLYYSQAPTWSAMDPRSWSQRQLISDHLRVFTPGDIEITAVGDLHAVFAASDQGAV